MIKHNQDGAVSGVVISLVFAIILLLGAIGFGAWAFSSRQDYKDNTDAKVNAAVQAAVSQESSKKDKQFAEDAKKPLKTYNGPEAVGSIVLQYPKTWSGYVDTTSNSANALSGYFNPGVVPSINDQNSAFALTVQVLNQTYAQVLQTYTGQQASQDSDLTISAYSLPKLPKIVGVKVSGTFQDGTTGTLILLPLRSQTLQIQTDGTQFLNDYNNNILPNFSFSP